jgi:hypothetical protein
MHGTEVITTRSTELTPYEQEQRDAIIKWHNEPPGVVNKALDSIVGPIAGAIRSFIPESAITAAIEGADWLAKETIAEAVPAHVYHMQSLDQASEAVRNWAIACAAGSGAAGGIFGFAGMAVDVPTVIVLALRTIRATGACYGYGTDRGPGEKGFVLGVMSAAGGNSQEEKVAALLLLRNVQVTVARQTFKSMASNAGRVQIGIVTARSLAKQLGINLTKRKMLQAIPVAGAVVGAAANGIFINDVYWAARRSYQQRWLADRGVWQEASPGRQ